MGYLSHHLAEVRLGKVGPFVRGDVLDLGCGTAEVAKRYGDQIDCYVGVDMRQNVIDKNKSDLPGCEFHCLRLDDANLHLSRQFDAILMVALIEHIFNQKLFFEQAAKHLKPNGSILITTPTPLGNDVVHRLGAQVGLFARSAADDHIVIYNKHRFHILASEVGLRLDHYETFEFGCNQFAILRKSTAAERH